ncbi:hypothetical protein Pcinc_004592 [Petrolisthes cinctipes]|uniref:Uncharacterized protein n=1 Tax=Petrolisthes cinctipes TaxID=88211 RepID=A0AAE1L1B8_PETCI|nr:hypothetical protein Pcinc_004592 [Petrolisthes cinctipes]
MAEGDDSSRTELSSMCTKSTPNLMKKFSEVNLKLPSSRTSHQALPSNNGLQLKQEESDRRHDETSKMYDDLAQKFSILQDFVASNVGCAPEEALTYATVAASPHPAT